MSATGGDGLLVLMVAEKPSIAQTVANALAAGQHVAKRKGVSPVAPVYEFSGVFRGYAARFRVTSTVGHMWSLDFPREYNDVNKVEPSALFDAPTQQMEDPRPRMSAHLAHEASGAHALVLWLDCDREGENICFEVMAVARPQMHMCDLGGYEGNVFRARFSSLAPSDLVGAMGRLGAPNLNESRSVDARQEIDLKLGVAFSRFQTRYFRSHFGAQLGKLSVTYGPCQSPTLWFCVHRRRETPPRWRAETSARDGARARPRPAAQARPDRAVRASAVLARQGVAPPRRQAARRHVHAWRRVGGGGGGRGGGEGRGC